MRARFSRHIEKRSIRERQAAATTFVTLHSFFSIFVILRIFTRFHAAKIYSFFPQDFYGFIIKFFKQLFKITLNNDSMHANIFHQNPLKYVSYLTFC